MYMFQSPPTELGVLCCVPLVSITYPGAVAYSHGGIQSCI